jgi:mRNA-degrading endonuclease HigB of HigAB toxin-antitoxin module
MPSISAGLTAKGSRLSAGDCSARVNACGNDYRLICRVTYANRWTDGTLLVKHFLTHAEYDKNKWCKDCIPQENDA